MFKDTGEGVTQHEFSWLDKLFEEIDEKFLNCKSVKWNTHKNRKTFMGELKTLVANRVRENTTPKNGYSSVRQPHVTKLSEDRTPVGHAIMTESDSFKGDEIKSKSQTKDAAAIEKVKNHTASMRTG